MNLDRFPREPYETDRDSDWYDRRDAALEDKMDIAHEDIGITTRGARSLDAISV